MKDLYAVLAVPRDANSATIRRAFREKVRSCHPDGGGSTDAFNELKAAYDILSNPLRRQRYDETGEVGDQASGDPRKAKIIEALCVGLDQALLKLNGGGAWRHSDIIPTMMTILASSLSETERHKLGFEAALDQANALQDRCRNSSGDNLMDIVIARRITACRTKISLLKEHIKVLEKSLEILLSTDFTPQLQITGDTSPQGMEPKYANISPLLDISSLIRFR
jgi:curved DNA-binding protein CbpA